MAQEQEWPRAEVLKAASDLSKRLLGGDFVMVEWKDEARFVLWNRDCRNRLCVDIVAHAEVFIFSVISGVAVYA